MLCTHGPTNRFQRLTLARVPRPQIALQRRTFLNPTAVLRGSQNIRTLGREDG